ncbi:MAG: DUF202 domain-containing protein [Oligoflexia bacterium]|nr:DUF202 domain-containing protein [Oligoflexia bacterium]
MSTNKKPYSKISKDQLILVDWLAVDRTILANKRTLLSYIRTAMAFFISGVTAIRFIETSWIIVVGCIFVIISIIILFFGIYDFYKYQKNVQELLKGENILPEPMRGEKEL